MRIRLIQDKGLIRRSLGGVMYRAGKHIFSSESVTEGHPDKVADQISDAILDAIMEKDPNGRVAAETFVTTGLAMVGGEITTDCYVDMPKVIRETIKEIGYTEPEYGFHWETCGVITTIDQQSPDIAQGVDPGGAGDQGMMWGFACNETEEFMPMPILLAHKLTRHLAKVRKNGTLNYLGPDGKSMVAVEYDGYNVKRVHSIILAAQHKDNVTTEKLREDLKNQVIMEVIPNNLIDKDTNIFINQTGRFVRGGPWADAGLTGRKIIVDTYGGMGSHGGGAFSGKDPTKVDRSASYMARHVAKNVVAAGLAERCEIQVSYVIGRAEPVSIMVETRGTGKLGTDVKLVEVINEVFDFRPKAIIDYLNLRRPIYRKTAAYGHFGRPKDEWDSFSWEKLNKVEELKKTAGI